VNNSTPSRQGRPLDRLIHPKGISGWVWADQTAAHSVVGAWTPRRPASCFDYVADFAHHADWATEPVKISPVDPGNTRGIGARFHAVGHQFGKDWPSELEVTVYDRPHVFEFTATGGPIGTPEDDPHRHTFTFTAEADGTRIEEVRKDPFPPEWPRAKRALTPVILFLSLGMRKRTMANLRDRIADLG
jgi:hypothetical protein